MSSYVRTAPLVSIHAPAQGATEFDAALPDPSPSFNPRSRTGSDLKSIQYGLDLQSFNPRSRTGSDLRGARRIHRPVRFNPRSRTGSDVAVVAVFEHLCSFNPRSRTGSDVVLRDSSVHADMFQSTLPHRERLATRRLITVGKMVFQSTLPHRERLL